MTSADAAPQVPWLRYLLFAAVLSALWLAIMSYVPFSAPVGMPMRVFLGEAQWWEPFASLAILLATAALAVWIGERIYRNSLLKTGPRVRLGEALQG